MLKIAGLYTSTNELIAPEGGLQVAKNVNINTPNVAEPRKGMERLDDSWTDAADRTKLLLNYKDSLLAIHSDAASAFYDRLAYYSGGTWINLGQIEEHSTAAAYRTVQSNGNLYVTSELGIRKWQDLTSTSLLETAGVQKGLSLTAAAAGDGSGFLTSGDTVAYRIVWGYTDENENLILGSPSQRINFTGSGGGTDNVDITAIIPSRVTTDFIYQLYRSKATNTGFPNDEMQLVFEGQPTSGEISAGNLTIADTTAENLRGATLYTSISQEGIENANDEPPVAADVTLFRNSVFYANTRSKDRYFLTLKSAADMAINDTFTITAIGTETFTAKGAEDASNFEFQLHTAGSAEQNTRNTALSFCRVMNDSTSGYYAFYLGNESTGEGLGEILIERRVFTAQQFSVTASNTTPWLPATIPTSGTDEKSTRDEFANGLSWSKPDQPEAVPLPNQVRIGSKDAAILRVVALDEAIIIFKEDGVYRLTGYYPSFEVELMDASIKLVGSSTPAVLSNEIYCLTTQGVAVISSNNVKIISTPIEDDIFSLFDSHLDNIKSYAFGFSHEATRRYHLYFPQAAIDTNATNSFVFNIFTRTWVSHDLKATTGFAFENEMYLGDGNSNFVLRAKSSGTDRDYADFDFTANITVINERVITLDSGVSNIEVGDILHESDTVYAAISAVDATNSQVTVVTNPGFTTTSVSILAAISTEIKWLPNDMKTPMVNKQIHSVYPMFKSGFTGTAQLDFSTDLAPNIESVDLVGSQLLGWGLSPWGESPWGDTAVKKPFRQWLPRSKQRCTWLIIGFRHKYGFSQWKLQGIKIVGDLGSEKTSK
jgi:hypothetical protein